MSTHPTGDRADALLRLHQDPALLTLVNVWDVASARVVAATPGTTALATASHAVAATFGYDDGEVIPRDLMLEMAGRIAAATDLPVTADLEAGYGSAGETVRRAIGLGIVGANIEDEMVPLPEAVTRMAEVVAAAEAEGVPSFVLNARTDAFLLAGDRPPADVLADAVERGRAYLEVGAPCVFVPGAIREDHIAELAAAFGPRRLTLIGLPGLPSRDRLEELGVARVSYGPMPQRVALTALQRMVEDVVAGGGVPEGVRRLT
jgi:2-methylisocitrate lyase-like PEP mutase family enzyme